MYIPEAFIEVATQLKNLPRTTVGFIQKKSSGGRPECANFGLPYETNLS